MVGLPIVVAAVVLIVFFFMRQKDPAKRARFLKRAGFALMALFTGFFALFVAGETFSDPGGWEALGLVAAWAAPLAALAALTWFRPQLATRLFAVLVAAAIGMSIWFAASPEAWRSFEDRRGPIRTIIVFALSAAVAVLGLKRTAVSGAMLLILGVVPIAVSSLGSDLGFTSLVVASSPPVVTGVLYLLSAAVTKRSIPPPSAEAGPEREAKAA